MKPRIWINTSFTILFGLLSANTVAANEALLPPGVQTMQANSANDNNTFLLNNKKQAGVTTLPSGLQYKVIIQGKGMLPKPGDVVTVNYEGKTIDGKIFDSSYKRGQPMTFPVNGVIPGWVEALQLMPVGSTYIFLLIWPMVKPVRPL